MSQTAIRQALLTRGTSYSISDTLIARAKFPDGQFRTRDSVNELPKLDFLEEETFDTNCENFPQIQSQLTFEPLQYEQPIKSKYSSCLASPDFSSLQSSPAISYVNCRDYKEQDSKELLQKSKKQLIFLSLLNKEPKPFSLRMHQEFLIDNRFEGGNLFAAFFSENEFDLLLSPDTDTASHFERMGFAISGIKQGKYVFKILNYMKQEHIPEELIFYDGANFFRAGEFVATYDSNFQRRTKFFYLDASEVAKMSFNQIKIVTMEQYKDNELEFKEYLKKLNLTLKSGKLKKGVEISYSAPGNYQAYCCQVEFNRDYDQLYIFNEINIEYSRLLIQIENLSKLVTNNVVIETFSFCRSYLGNEIPIIKIYEDSGANKKNFVIIARSSPFESCTSEIAMSFARDLLQEYDSEYESEIMEAEEKQQNVLKAEFNKHKHARGLLLSQYVFYILPDYAVDGSIIGNSRCDNFGFNLEQEFNSDGNYKIPQENAFQMFMKNIPINELLDLRASNKIGNWEICVTQEYEYERVLQKTWESLGELGVVPNMEKDMLLRLFSHSEAAAEIKAFLTETSEEKDDLPYIDIQRADVSEYLEKAIYEFILKERDAFREYSVIRFAEQFKGFGVEQSYCGKFNDSQSNSIGYLMHNKGNCFAMTVYYPLVLDAEEYGFEELELFGQDLLKVVEFLHNEEDIEAVRVEMAEEYSRWVSAALLAEIGYGHFIEIDTLKLEPEIKQELPEALSTYSEMPDKVRYKLFHDFMDRINFRAALGFNLDTEIHFDSEDSVPDAEINVIKVKESDNDREERYKEMQLIQDILRDKLQTAEKPKRGKKGKKAKKTKKE